MVTVSYLIPYQYLLQNVTDITKCDIYYITKCDHRLLQNVSSVLLQNELVLLQNATAITKYDDIIRKWDTYYKIRRLLQNASVHNLITIF